MTQITELKHEDKTRRRTNALAIAGAMLVVGALGVGWFASQAGGGSDSSPAVPASTRSASALPEVNLEPGQTVGTRLQPPLVAKAPDSWAVFKDDAYVNLGAEDMGPFVEIDGPLLEVFDPKQDTGVAIPPDGYANWLRENTWLEVLDDRMVVVDGDRFPQLTVTMAADAPDAEFRLGRYADTSHGERWPDFNWDEVVTQTVIEVDGETMVVTSIGTASDPAPAELAAALELVLSTMKLPN